MKNSNAPSALRVIGRAIVDWWDGWLDMVMVMLVWFFAQLTIVLGPPATFGLYYVVYRMVNGEASGVRGMIEGARQHFGKALLWGLINVLVALTYWVNYNFYASIEAVWSLSIVFLLLLVGVLWILTQFYALPFYFEQDIKSLKVALRNGVLTALASPLFSLMMLVIIVLVSALSVLLVIPIFLGLPALIPMLGFRALYSRLEAFGLRQPEKTPRELELEQGSRIQLENKPFVDHRGRPIVEPSDAGLDDAPGSRAVADEEGQVEKKE